MSTHIRPVDFTKLIENRERRLHIQTAALADTLNEIATVEKAELATPGAYGTWLEHLRTKRDRQHKAVEASKAALDLYKRQRHATVQASKRGGK